MPPRCSCGCDQLVWRSNVEWGTSYCGVIGGVEICLAKPRECMARLGANYPDIADRLLETLLAPESQGARLQDSDAPDATLEAHLGNRLVIAQQPKRRRLTCREQHAEQLAQQLAERPGELPSLEEALAGVMQDDVPLEQSEGDRQAEPEIAEGHVKQRAERPELLRRLQVDGPDALGVPARLREFAQIYLAMAAETLDRIGATSGAKEPLVAALPRGLQDALRERERCSFNAVSDTTTLAIVNRMPQLKEDGPQLLYHVVCAATVLNSRERYNAFADVLDVHKPLTAQGFREMYLKTFGKEEAPPLALRQCTVSMLSQSRKGSNERWGNLMFQGSAMFIEALAPKCGPTWDKLQQLLEDVPAPAYLKEAPAVAILRKELGLAPFLAQHVARLLSIAHPKLYNIERLDCGPGAVHGLLLLHGVPADQAKAFKNKLAQVEATALFANLLQHLPGELAALDAAGIMTKAAENYLWPFAARTVQHMLCEARKAWAPEGRPIRRTATPNAEYCQLWRGASPMYMRCDGLLAEHGRPQQLRFLARYGERPQQTRT